MLDKEEMYLQVILEAPLTVIRCHSTIAPLGRAATGTKVIGQSGETPNSSET